MTQTTTCPICKSNNWKREQKLIDILFEITMRMHGGQIHFTEQQRDELGAYVATQLRECGFDTQPMGMSWGVLK